MFASRLVVFAALAVILVTHFLPCGAQVVRPASLKIAGIMPLTIPLAGGGFTGILDHLNLTTQLTTQFINNDTSILRNTTLTISLNNDRLLQPVALGSMLRESRTGSVGAVGGAFDLEAIALAASSTVLKFPLIVQYSGLPALSNRELYPYTCTISASFVNQVTAIFDLLDHFYKITRQIQWRQPGIITTATPYGIPIGQEFVNQAGKRDFFVTSYQQILGTTNDNNNLKVRDITQQVLELKNTKSRVFVSMMQTADAQTLLAVAQKSGMFAPDYVWICSDGCAQNSIYLNLTLLPNQTVVVPEYFNALPGLIGVTYPIDLKFDRYQYLLKTYIDTYNGSILTGIYPAPLYDAYYAMASALDMLIERNMTRNVTNIVAAVRNVTFRGMTGWVSFDDNCSRRPVYNIVNAWRGFKCPECLGGHPLDVFANVGTWNYTTGLDFTSPIRFFDGTTKIPDLNLHQSFEYFDCTDGKKKTDETGKTVNLDKPKWGAKQIDIDYYCDEYLDCDDMSDEPYDCVPSFKILFIIYGIITGLLILFTIFVFVPFTILFGYIIPRKRVRASSPLFLLIIIISGVLGVGSTYAWYGKPQSVACGFQPWLLGLAIVSMNSALIAKTFRIWRVFRSPFTVKVISNVELMVLWIILVAPVILILFLWTLVSTPTAKLEEHDGLEHLVCAGGGFTDSNAAGYAWFFILVGYQGLVMLLGIILTFAIRNVPSKFNEGKLIALSIYNITLLGVIVIPVFLVLRYIIPFVAWIIRTSVIIYVFTATLALQFIPKIWGVILTDKLKDPRNQNSLEPRTDPEMTI